MSERQGLDQADKRLRRVYHQLLQAPDPMRAEYLVACARSLLPHDRATAICVVGSLVEELRGRGRFAEKLALAVYAELIAGTP